VFSLSSEPIRREPLTASVANVQAGALVTFEGWVRNHNEGRDVVLLEYEAFEPLSRKEAEKILQEAGEKFNVRQMVCIHRVGPL